MATVPRSVRTTIERSPAGAPQMVTRVGAGGAPLTMNLDELMPTATPAELDTLEAHGGADVAGAVKAERTRRSKGGRVDPRAVGKRDVMAEATGHTEPPPGEAAPTDSGSAAVAAASQQEPPLGSYARDTNPSPTGAQLSPEDRDYLIRTIIGEAANQGAIGQEAVAHVVLNRVKQGWGASAKDVVLQKGQFEPWQTRRGQLLGVRTDAPEYKAASRAVDAAMLGSDPTGGAVHFLNPVIVRGRTGGRLPAWAQGKPSAVIGQHAFFTSPARAPGVESMMAQGEPLPAGQAGVDLPAEPQIGLQDLTGAAGVASIQGGSASDDLSQPYLAYRQVADADDIIAREEAYLRAKQAQGATGQGGAAPGSPAAAGGAAQSTSDPMAAARAATQARQAGAATAATPGASLYPADAEQVRAAQSIIAPQTAPPEPAKPLTWGEIRRGMYETPLQAVGGVFDAAKQVMQAGDDLGRWLDEKLGADALPGSGTGKTPEEHIIDAIAAVSPNEPRTRVGEVVRGFTNFAAPFGWLFGKASKLLKVLGIEGATGKVAAGALAGAATGAAAVDPFEPGISNLVQQFPALQNPVTEYLAAQPGDTNGEARLKKALESAGFGVLADGMLSGFRAIRNWRAARGAADAAPASDSALPKPYEPKWIRQADGSLEEAGSGMTIAPNPGGGFDIDTGRGVLWHETEEAAIRQVESLAAAGRAARGAPAAGDAEKIARAMGRTDAGATEAQQAAALAAEHPPVGDEAFSVLGDARPGAPLLSRKPIGSVAAAKMQKADAATAEVTNPGVVTGGPASDKPGLPVTTGEMKDITPPGQPEIYINFARIDAQEDVQSVIRRMAGAYKGSIDEATRGVQTFEDTKKLADDLGMDVPTLLARRQGQPFNAEEALAARQLWTASAEKLMETAKAASAPNAGAVDLFNFRRMMSIHYAIQQEVIGARTETARALASWRIPAGGSERAKQIEDMIAASGGPEFGKNMATMIAKLGDEGVTPASLAKATRKSFFAKTNDTLREIYINALLSGLGTHVVNAFSNTLVAAGQIIETGVGEMMGRMTGSTAGVVPGETAALAYGTMSALKDGLVLMAKDLRAGGGVIDYTTGDLAAQATKMDPMARGISSEAYGISAESGLGQVVDFLGHAVRVPGRALGASDTLFKVMGYRGEIARQALRQATQEGLTGEALGRRVEQLKADPPETIRMAAIDAAEYRTFTDALGDTGKMFMAWRGRAPLAWIIFPFVKTPTNILKYSFERTPFAPLVGRWRADFAAGGARRQMALSKMATGSAMMAVVADYADQGLISGAGPSDGPTRERMMGLGWRPWSVHIGDRWYNYNRTDPLGMTMGIAATLAESLNGKYMDEGDADSVNEVLAASIMATSETIVSKTYLQGIADLSEAMNDPQRYSADYINKFLSGFVPNALAYGGRIIDPTLREKQDFGDAALAKIQAYAETLPAKRDLWGFPISSATSGFGNFFDATSPIAVSKDISSPVDSEMLRLGVRQQRIDKGNQAWSTSDGTSVSVNLKDWPKVYEAYSELAGHALKHPAWKMGAKEFLDAVVNGEHPMSRAYAHMSDGQDGDKATFIKKTIQDYRMYARDAIMADPRFASFAAYVRQLQAQQMQKQLEAVH